MGNIITTFKSFLNESLNKIDGWEKISLDDIKNHFTDKQFIDGGIVDDSYSKTESIIIDDVDTAIEILQFLDEKMYPYGIGGQPTDIKKVWDRFPNSVVKMALPRFTSHRYDQKVAFVFDNGEKYPPVFAYDSSHTESPYIWKRQSNTSWEIFGERDIEKYFNKNDNKKIIR